jgi:hypothetical protein
MLIHGYGPQTVPLDIILSFVSTAQFIGEFWKNWLSTTNDVAPTVMVLFRIHS